MCVVPVGIGGWEGGIGGIGGMGGIGDVIPSRYVFIPEKFGTGSNINPVAIAIAMPMPTYYEHKIPVL